MSFNEHPEGPGFRVPPPLEDRTVILPRVKRTPEPVAAVADAGEADGLVAEIAACTVQVQRFMPARADLVPRTHLRSQVAKLVAAAQRLDSLLSELDRANVSTSNDAAFIDWLHAPGGERG